MENHSHLGFRLPGAIASAVDIPMNLASAGANTAQPLQSFYGEVTGAPLARDEFLSYRQTLPSGSHRPLAPSGAAIPVMIGPKKRLSSS